jgi:solute carrier family 25 protein 33/36
MTSEKLGEQKQPLMAVKPSVSRTSHYSNWAHFVAGGTGGAVGAIVTCPLEVIKTRLQALTKTTELTGMIGTRTYKAFLEIWKHEGIRGLWKGIGPNLIGVGPSRAIHFSTYSGTKHFLTNTLDFKESSGIHLTSAIVAGVTVHTVTAPIWLVKTRMQLQVEGKTIMPYRNSFDCVRRVWTEEGIRGFYKGLVASYVSRNRHFSLFSMKSSKMSCKYTNSRMLLFPEAIPMKM